MASLTDFKAISFDCYGTLIDWEAGIIAAAAPVLSQLPSTHPYNSDRFAFMKRFNEHQRTLEIDTPNMPYNDVLATSYMHVAAEAGINVSSIEAARFGRGARDWPAFLDTVHGLQTLKKHYKLIIISNVDDDNIAGTLKGPLAGVEFDAVLTAQQIGSYKPDHRNFAHLFGVIKERFGLSTRDLLHTAKSLPVDHVPAKELGLTSAWIARGQDGLSAMGGDIRELKDKVAFKWRYPSIGVMAEDVERAFYSKAQGDTYTV
ncbi:hypothetical protein OIDMADRAFT_45583 [Oidiodendron maius Zn]|uniref:Haloacid dehalogenase n=1 Tax=Oidiodendron maius (strain Zn) TaxID=913774 RepID=A0A0C3GES2_OIDMZ|nr:hypothetical protein OIDMADRAFT_45583 [Oidiodendron maius Zn]